jgi:uncharacterized protein YbcC (UPF0753/DUF2309 family)
MQHSNYLFDVQHTLHELKHYLPAQAALKDFVHHNTLHAFQDKDFFEALRNGAGIFGYKTSLSVGEYRQLFQQKRISLEVIQWVTEERKGKDHAFIWMQKMLEEKFPDPTPPRIGALRAVWKNFFKIDLNSRVHPILFRTLNSYLDQGIAIWRFPVWEKGFLDALREMERNSLTSFFRTKRASQMLLDGTNLQHLLQLIVGDESLFEQYLFDQQFAHPGWSGLVSVIEDQPQTLLDSRKISLQDLITFELLLELDFLDSEFGEIWSPLCHKVASKPSGLFQELEKTEQDEVVALWQQAYEWTYLDEVLAGVQTKKVEENEVAERSFQALFCIDDRECSIRRHIENQDPRCETYGTPGHFGVEFYYRPQDGKFNTKVCPAPITPKYLIKELGNTTKKEKDPHFAKHSHHLIGGLLISQTLGFWSALKLFFNVFKPTMSPGTSYSFRHMDQFSDLTIENTDASHQEDGLQVGFNIEEMAVRVENVLKSIGLVDRFAPIVYVIGHGASSVNNTHYAGYDCGACCGRPGSVNARVFSTMANNKRVRAALSMRGIEVPDSTQFLGGLHDTTRDEIVFYDEKKLSTINRTLHSGNVIVFNKALTINAKERSRRFQSINTKQSAEEIHEKIRLRSVSLFEPRPELNHATNALCVVARRDLTKGLFLDRRSFLNSYNYQIDPDGKYLLNILNAAAPVCGGINLEYFFSRVDNQKLGAGSKLPHNVMGLIGVANGIEGDLRPGLPSQMIELHDPVRLMIIVEHFPEVVLDTIQRNPATYEWFANGWVLLAAVQPVTREIFIYGKGGFHIYRPLKKEIERLPDLMEKVEQWRENFPVFNIKG